MQVSELVYAYRKQIGLLLLGLILIGLGIFLTSSDLLAPAKVEVIDEDTPQKGGVVFVDITGAIKSPGVYEVKSGSRISDVLEASGGVIEGADEEWIDKNLNRAAVVIDAQKIYIPFKDEESSEVIAADDVKSDKVNINTASVSELEALWGIGRVTAENIIEHRPYSSMEELVSRKVLKQNVYDANKDLLSVF